MQVALRFVMAGLFLACQTTTASCQDLPTARPGDVGVSPKQIEELAKFTTTLVDEGKISGGVTMMARQGKVVHQRAIGLADREAGKRMRIDTIFRLASMSKPITSVAVMILYDQDKIKLRDPISKYIPEFKDPQIIVNNNPQVTVPAKSEISIHDLLLHMSGLGDAVDDSPLFAEYNKAGLYRVLQGEPSTLDQAIPKLASFPLLFEPGDQWRYGLSTDVLGYLVEVVSEQTLDEFLEKQLFEPLGMVDTHFFLPDGKTERLAAVYELTTNGQLSRMPDGIFSRRVNRPDLGFDFSLTHRLDYPYAGPQKYLSGAGGLCSTAGDYIRFCLMLANRGELNGKRILKAETVDLMMSNHIGELTLPEIHDHEKFGYGFLVVDRPGSPFHGACQWAGAYATFFWILPSNRSVLVLMMQSSQASQVMVIDLLAPVRRLAEATLVDQRCP